MINRFISIKKIGEGAQQSDFESAIVDIQHNINQAQYKQAMTLINNIGNPYQEILAGARIDLQNAYNLQQISNEIYKYLEALSN